MVPYGLKGRAMPDELLSIWTVYEKPTDYPDSFVARRFVVNADGHGPTDEVIVSPSYERIADEMLNRGLINIGRQPEDDRVIKECWV
jgi:hypothetical protein